MIKMPAIVMERPKISRPMWNSLKAHIIRERQRKKQEQEADAEVERQRREREDQQKEQEMTLEETKEQVAQSESRLAQLKEDKHQLFLQLKKVLNEDDTRKKIKESNFNEMMLIHGYQTTPLAIHPHAPQLYLHNVAQPRPMYPKGIKEDPMAPVQSAPPPSLYTPSMSVIPPPSHQLPSTAPQKRSRSPSPPPQQLYHSYKPQASSLYNPKSSSGNLYGSSPAVPGSIFYTHSVSVSAAHNAAAAAAAAAAGYPPGSLYNYSSSGHSSSARPSYPSQPAPAQKEDGPPPPKHHAPPPGLYLPHNPPLPSRSYLQSMEQLMKNPSPYGTPEQDKFYLSSHGPPQSGSSVSGSNPPSSGMRPHVAHLASVSTSGSSPHPSGMPIQQTSLGKGGSITSGHPLRPPPSTAYHTSVSVPHGQSPRLLYTQSGGQPPQPSSRYTYGNANQRDM